MGVTLMFDDIDDVDAKYLIRVYQLLHGDEGLLPDDAVSTIWFLVDMIEQDKLIENLEKENRLFIRRALDARAEARAEARAVVNNGHEKG